MQWAGRDRKPVEVDTIAAIKPSDAQSRASVPTTVLLSMSRTPLPSAYMSTQQCRIICFPSGVKMSGTRFQSANGKHGVGKDIL